MTKNSDIYPEMTETRSRKYRMKTCSISGKRFKATSDNFYVNENSNDGLHPYHKKHIVLFDSWVVYQKSTEDKSPASYLPLNRID